MENVTLYFLQIVEKIPSWKKNIHLKVNLP